MTLYLPDEQKYIDKLTDIIEAHLSIESFGVSELAKEMGISHSSLHRKIKAIEGKSVSRFIRETKLKYAVKLLQNQSITVAEVAYGVGFGSTTYFSKCFHDYYGYPPSVAKNHYEPKLDSGENIQSIKEDEKRIKSIAVLPFDNYTGDENQTFIIYGLHDALISELGKLGTIRVISKTSALAYLHSEKTIKEIASELGVDAIIEASVLAIDENIRIQLKLINAFPEEKQLWVQSFDVGMADILKLFNKVIKKVANEIKLSLSPERQTLFEKNRIVNPDCYKAYLRGKYKLYESTPKGIQEGIKYLHEAIRIDPAEAFAHAGLALGYLEVAHGPFATNDAYIKAESAALQAFKLDPTMAEVHLALGEVYMYSSWKFNKAEKLYKKAIHLKPSLSMAHYHYSWALYLFGRIEEAVVEHELAHKYDPFNPLLTAFLGLMYSFSARYDKAISQAHKSFELLKDCPPAYFVLSETYLATGQFKEAIQVSEKLAVTDPAWSWVLGYVYAMTKNVEKAEKILVEVEKFEKNGWIAMGLAVIYGALGRIEDAFKWIAFEPHHLWIPWVAVMPMWKPLHNDPRFKKFVKNLKLPEK